MKRLQRHLTEHQKNLLQITKANNSNKHLDTSPLFRMIYRLSYFENMTGFAGHKNKVKELFTKSSDLITLGAYQPNDVEEFWDEWNSAIKSCKRWIHIRINELDEPNPKKETELTTEPQGGSLLLFDFPNDQCREEFKHWLMEDGSERYHDCMSELKKSGDVTDYAILGMFRNENIVECEFQNKDDNPKHTKEKST